MGRPTRAARRAPSAEAPYHRIESLAERRFDATLSAMMKLIAVAALAVVTLTARAEIKTEVVEYQEGTTTLEGFVAYDATAAAKRPVIMVVHQWMGLGDYEKKRAEMLAGLGYVAFCADIYGKGVRASEPGEAAKLAGKYKSDVPLLRARVKTALEAAKRHPKADPANSAAIGYCFGGTTVLELARAGADTKGVVSFHGGLGTPAPATAGTVKAKVLVLHGADDPFVPPAEVAAFEKEMRDAAADWQLVSYGGAVHSFTDWKATNLNLQGAAYHEKADQRSWAAMEAFFGELFGPAKTR
jgi:dienelactone hydrolase